MKTNLSILFLVLAIMLTACQTATPLPPLTATMGSEFTIAPDQTITITDAHLTIRLVGVAGDERCPSEIECAISGPVSISLSVQAANEDPTNINLQTFTSNDGRAPDMHFEGIEESVIYQGYSIRVAGVLPYPTSPSKKIKNDEYRVMLIVTQE